MLPGFSYPVRYITFRLARSRLYTGSRNVPLADTSHQSSKI
jgi:hypothetical protein